MTYGVISQWTSNVVGDAAKEAEAREKYLPKNKALGALHAYFMYTSDTTFSIVVIYPDEATATAAIEKQNAIRAQAIAENPIKLVGEVRGEILASF